MKYTSILIAALLFTGTLAGTAQSQALRPVINAKSALAIVQGCQAFAIKHKRSHAISVYDAGGNMLASLRMDGNGPGIGLFAAEKAKAAAIWGFPTSEMENAIKEVPGFVRAPGVVTVAGGVPVFAPGYRQAIGGVGASGEAPKDDAACAEAGIRAAGLLVKRSAEQN